MIVTLVTKYDGKNGETYVGLVKGQLTKEERQQLRNKFQCDEFHIVPWKEHDEKNNMFFREFDLDKIPTDIKNSIMLVNVSDEEYP